jgi:hypothetical protein
MSIEVQNRPPQDFQVQPQPGITEAVDAMDHALINGQPGYNYLEQTARFDSVAPHNEMTSVKTHGDNADLTVETHLPTGDVHLVEAQTVQRNNLGVQRNANVSLDNTGNDERTYATVTRNGKERLYTGNAARRVAPFVVRAAADSVVKAANQPQQYR